MCTSDPSGKVPVKDVADAYNRWCEEQGEEPAQGRTFNRMMEERGYERKQARVHGMSGKAWICIRLRTHEELVTAIRPRSTAEVGHSEAKSPRFQAHQERQSVALQKAG